MRVHHIGNINKVISILGEHGVRFNAVSLIGLSRVLRLLDKTA